MQPWQDSQRVVLTGPGAQDAAATLRWVFAVNAIGPTAAGPAHLAEAWDAAAGSLPAFLTAMHPAETLAPQILERLDETRFAVDVEAIAVALRRTGLRYRVQLVPGVGWVEWNDGSGTVDIRVGWSARAPFGSDLADDLAGLPAAAETVESSHDQG